MNKDDLREWINQLSQDNATPAKVLNLNEGASETERLCRKYRITAKLQSRAVFLCPN